MCALGRKLVLCVLFSCLFGNILALRVNRRNRHHHHHHPPHPHRHSHDRRFGSVTTAPDPTTSYLGDAVIADIVDVEHGLTNLPQDLLDFVDTVSQHLQEEEALLASLWAHLAPTTSPGSLLLVTHATSISAPTPPSVVSTGSTLPTTLITSSVSEQSSLCAHGGAGSLSPCTDLYTPASSPTPDAGYVFDADRKSNVAVYYGQTPATTAGGLLTLCESPNVDIAILAFVTSFDPLAASFGPSCVASSDPSSALPDCSELAPQIARCQQLGKPVLVSLGGYMSNVNLSSDEEATSVARTLWNTFGAGESDDGVFRPFGPDIVLDGFDLDDESKHPASSVAFASALRSLFLEDAPRRYYLSTAPQCPRPDASIPIGTMALADFVFVQFYNNPSCAIDSLGFQDSFAAWSNDLAAVSSFTKVFVGVSSFAGAGTGHVAASELEVRVSLARQFYVANLGGIMLWDGSEALANVDQYGNDYLVYAKGSLE